MSEQNKFYVLIHMTDLQYVDEGGEYYTSDVMKSIKFGKLDEATKYREGFDFPEEFEIYEVSFCYSLKRVEEKEYESQRSSHFCLDYDSGRYRCRRCCTHC